MSHFLDTADTIEPGYGFRYFGPYHLMWLAVLVIFAVFMSVQYKKRDAAARDKWRKRFAIAILLDEVWKMFWLTVGGNYTVDYLPLHLCSINILLIAVHAWRPSRVLDNFLYAVCVPAACAAMLFPTWDTLPALNFMHLHSFTVHILLAVYPIMVTAGGEIRPDWRQLPKCLLLAAVLAAPVYGVNRLLGTNFMFLMRADEGNPLLLFDGGQAAADVLGQLRPLHRPHGVEGIQCLVHHGTEIFTDGLQVLLRLGDGEHVREPGQLLRGDALLRTADGGQGLEGLGILGRKGGIHADLDGIRRRGIHGDENVHLPPGDYLLYPALHGRLGEGVHPGHLHGAVQISVVDTADLHGDVPEVPGGAGTAVACHTLDQS